MIQQVHYDRRRAVQEEQEQLSIDKVLEEIKAVQSGILGDLMHQLSIQRAINRQQDETIVILRDRIKEMTSKTEE